MIYTPLTNKALRLAYTAHAGQADQSGVPYIFHPFHLAEQMTDEIAVCVALLHDVMEDTTVTLDDLKAAGFPGTVTDALQLLTHDPASDYFDYVRAIKSNPIAKAVKCADLKHNADESRLVGTDVSEEQLEYWRKKYRMALDILMQPETDT